MKWSTAFWAASMRVLPDDESSTEPNAGVKCVNSAKEPRIRPRSSAAETGAVNAASGQRT